LRLGIRGVRRRPISGCRLVCYQFNDGFSRARGVAPKALGGWRHSKLDPHRAFILRRVAEKDDISMPELAGELQAASGVKADPASQSRWLIRNGLSFKKKPSGQRMRSARRAPGARGVEG
jgi:transposase